VGGIEIEGSNDIGVDVQYPWENAPRRFHEHPMHIKSSTSTSIPSRRSIQEVLDAAHYHPKDDLNFLRDWKRRHYPTGWDNRPSRGVSLEDARAYAAWAGKHLPHEWEWQYAAQGTDGPALSWGNQWDTTAVPEPIRAARCAVPIRSMLIRKEPVRLRDGSRRQCLAMDGRVHGRTHPRGNPPRWQLLPAAGVDLVFPQAYKLIEHGKLLMMSPSMDRSGAVGFRLVQDAR